MKQYKISVVFERTSFTLAGIKKRSFRNVNELRNMFFAQGSWKGSVDTDYGFAIWPDYGFAIWPG